MCSTITYDATEAQPETSTMPIELLEREITEQAAHINAAIGRWLRLVSEFDRREGWAVWGCRSCVHWLSYCCGISPGTARDQLRVARRLDELPGLRSAFGAGELCYSQVRALCRVATPDTEADLVEVARHATAAQLETIVRAYRGVLEVALGDHQPEYRRRWVRCRHDDHGSLLIRARLPAEEGALVLKALEAGRDALRADSGGAEGASEETTQIGDTGSALVRELDGYEAQGERQAVSNADALVLMSQTLLAQGAGERSSSGYEVVVRVDAAALASPHDHRHDPDRCTLDGGAALNPETARRLGCDGSVVRILERDGRPLSVGRRTRSIAPALRRALRSRDRTCRYPGCAQTRFLHAHHLEHWAAGGRTDLCNLVQLCPYHHRLVHEGGYAVTSAGAAGLRFRRPDGRPVEREPSRPCGNELELRRRHRAAGVIVDHQTCVPMTSYERFSLAGVVDGLAEADPRLRE